MKLIYKIVVVRQITERVWFEISGVDSAAEAVEAYKEGDGSEIHRKHLSTDRATIEDVYEEKAHAL